MVEDASKNDQEKLEFDSTGQALAYISLDQARVSALRHARDNRSFYGRRYARRDLVWEVVGAEETEDYYEVKLSYRPARGFRGRPGVEQFTIDKTGPIEFRQILEEPVEPRGLKRRSNLVALVVLVGLAAAAAIVIFVLGPPEEDPAPPLPPELVAVPQSASDFGVLPTLPAITSLSPQPAVAGPVSSEGGCDTLADATLKVEQALAIASTFKSPLPVEFTQLSDQAQDAMARGDIGAACESLDRLLLLLGEAAAGLRTQPEAAVGLEAEPQPAAGFTAQPEATIAPTPSDILSPTPVVIPTPTSTLNPTTPAPAPVPSPEPVNTTGGMVFGASISGRVTDAESGRPLANVEVRGENVLDRGPGANARAGEDGRYILRGLAPGSYRIRAEAEEAVYIQQYYNNRLGWDAAEVVTVRSAEVIEDFNFVLEIGGTISGVVSDKVTGLPLQGVRIKPRSAEHTTESYANTDASGSYVLQGLAPGTHLIWTDTERTTYIRTFYGDVIRWNDADWIIIDGKEQVNGIDLNLEQGSTISGRALDGETGRPLSGLNVRARLVNGNDYASDDTGLDGTYTLSGIPEGMQEIIVNGRGYIEERIDLEIEGRSVIQDFDISLTLGGAVSGTVIDGDTGFPLANLELHAERLNDGHHVAWERTDAEGRFILRGLASGEIHVIVEGQGYIPQRLRVSVSGQETVAGVILELSSGGIITGRVTDSATGIPIAGITIRQDWVDEDFNSEARTDDQGVYRLVGMGEGRHRLRIEDDDQNYVRQYYNNTIDWDRADLVRVRGREGVGNIDFSLTLGAMISGRVADGLTGRPISGMDVQARLDRDDISYASTNSDGNYVLRGVPNGTVEVIVRGQGYIEQRKTVRVSDGQDVTGLARPAAKRQQDHPVDGCIQIDPIPPEGDHQEHVLGKIITSAPLLLRTAEQGPRCGKSSA